MKLLENFSKEVINIIKQHGIIVSTLDEYENVINYYNLPQWYKDVNGHIFECLFSELPEQAKNIENGIDGETILLKVKEGDLFVLQTNNEQQQYIVKFNYDTFLERNEIILQPLKGGNDVSFLHGKKVM